MRKGIIIAALIVAVIAVVAFFLWPRSNVPQHNYDWSRLEGSGTFRSYTDEAGNEAQLGVDVSYHNHYVNWSALADAGVDFAYIRCGWRGYTQGEMHTDPMAGINYNGARNAGIEVATYFFSQAITVEEAIEEADFACDFADSHKLSHDYPIAFDMEENGVENERIGHLTTQERTDIAMAFCKRVEERGYTPIIYGNEKWLDGKFDLETICNAYDLWLAEYAATPRPSHMFAMWQYCSDGKIEGNMKNIDMNLMFPKPAEEE